MSEKIKIGKPQRIRLSSARISIENAFANWKRWAGGAGDADDQVEYEMTVERSKRRVMAFLDQCETDQKRMEAALAVCRTLVEADETMEGHGYSKASGLYKKAANQAREALADD